ncbi:Aspartyl protease [Rubritalea squalenifaciens DSM 18772]|uniref:Aspartyl protease n=1 Tax=Rubritalea squalenifaciens DSM 18772 TaxID=1123071 RepID=A0A1M6QGG2_9BACT|nr:pepsin/retropepsin-like aspartic protease family protein [Rubritalea squalenifaciens]SHK19255.1 Aspartyl protease [Rubritalea squalenifaciens DSM 18772]
MIKTLKYTSMAMLCALTTLCAQNTEQAFTFRPIKVEATDNGGLFTATVKVEDTNARFLIDTGCAYTLAYDTDFLKSMGKELTAQGRARGVGGDGKAFRAVIEKSTVGNVVEVGKQENARVLPVKHLEHLKTGGQPTEIRGLLGAPLMKKARGVFDYGNPRILVPTGNAPKGVYQMAMKQQGATVLPLMEGENSFPYIDLKIGDTTYAFLIDTGANAHVISTKLVEKLQLQTEDKDVAVRGMTKAQGVKVVRVKDSVMGKHFQLSELKLHVIDTQSLMKGPGGMEIGGIIGTGLLKQLKAQLDFDSYTLIVPKR